MNDKTQKPKKKTANQIEKLMILMKKHKIDYLEVDGVKITISKHEYPSARPTQSTYKDPIDEILFGSNPQ